MENASNGVNSSRWTIDETKILLSLWCEERIQDQLDGTVRDAEVYKVLEKHMNSNGFNRKSTQIRTRLKILKQQYRQQRDKLATTGSSGKITFPYFAQMDSVLGQRDSTAPTGILESTIPGLEDNNGESVSSQNLAEEENPESDMDTLVSIDVDNDVDLPSVATLPTQEQSNDDVNEQNVAATPQPSPSSSRPRRKKKTLKDILPATMEKCMNTFLEHQEKADKELMDLEKQQLAIEKENLEIKKQALELLKKAFS